MSDETGRLPSVIEWDFDARIAAERAAQKVLVDLGHPEIPLHDVDEALFQAVNAYNDNLGGHPGR